MTESSATLAAKEFRLEADELRLPLFDLNRAGRPVVIAIEGANGTGKSTLCSRLAPALGATAHLGTDPAWFAEPFKSRMIRDADWFASAMFFLSGCFEQMRLLRSSREQLVVMDRCLWSTLAVHAATDTTRLRLLVQMLGPIASSLQVPKVTLVLEASFATCQARIARKTGAARALDELTATPAFHAREQAFYRWLSGQVPNVLFLTVDHLDPEQVVGAAVMQIEALL